MRRSLSAFALPYELLEEIIKSLPLPDQRSLSLTCQVARKLTLQFIFGHLRYTDEITDKIRNIHLARNDIKEAIRKLELTSRFDDDIDNVNIIFEFLETLPNLKTFKLIQSDYLVLPAHTSELIASLRHVPLLEFVLYTGAFAGPPTAGLSGLEKLSITWQTTDEGARPGTHTHLYELIRPSLTTLVDIHIDDLANDLGTDFDLQLLKPAGNTLRSFKYVLASNDESILDTIPAIFPHLTELDLCWGIRVTKQSVLWKDAHIKSLAKNKNLVDLTLSSDFEVEVGDTVKRFYCDYPWYVRSYKRRLKTTMDVAAACEKLQKCAWRQIPSGRPLGLKHYFVVEGRSDSELACQSGTKPWVVRGLQQDWMGRNQEQDGVVVKCRLEDLPGNIIGENDSSDDEI